MNRSVISSPLGLHSKKFAEKVKQMNQTGGQQVVLNASEATNLMHDLFDLLAQIAELSQTKKNEVTETVQLKGERF
jgi:hypothetical protein